MKTMLQRLRPYAASLLTATGLLLLLLAPTAWAGNYCNNPVQTCDPDNPLSECYRPKKPTCEPKDCNYCTKSPCYVGSGVYVSDAFDLALKTSGLPIVVSRHYDSSHAIGGDNGYGWISSLSAHLYYATYLKSAPSTYQREVDVRLDNGNLYRFVENADGSFSPPIERFDTLVRNGDGTWDLWLQRTRSHYHFASNGNLLSIVDDYGNTQTWSYVADRLDHIEDTSGSGRSIDITYGADGRISDITDFTGRGVHYTYNSSGVLISATNAASQTTTYSYVNGKYVPLLNGITDPWSRLVTTVVYDAQDRVRSYTENGETYTYTYGYGGNANLTAKSDSSGNLWQYPFLSTGQATEARPPGGGAAASDAFYANGLIQLHTDAAGVKTYFTYDSRGNPLTVTADYQGPTAVEWRYTYDANFPSLPTTIKPFNPSTGLNHPDWQGSKFEYYPPGSDAPGAMYKAYVFDNDGTTARLLATNTYNTHGRVLTSEDALGNVTEYEYDAAGNLITVTRPANNDAGTHPVTTNAYDSLGRLTSTTDANGHTMSYTYDLLDRVATMTLPKPTPSSTLNFVTTFHHDEYDVTTQLLFQRTVDPNGRTTKLGADQYGQPVQTIDEAGNIIRNVFTKGLLTSRIDANGYTTSYSYDARRRLSTTTYPDGTTEVATYYADDNTASRRDRANQTTSYIYDRHKRLVTTSYPNTGVITRTYQGQKLTQINDTFASPSETHTFAYDNSFRLITEVQAGRGTVTRTYTTDDRLLTVSAGGTTRTFGYYPDGSLRTIDWSVVSGSFKYDYTLAGIAQSVTFPNGQTRTYTFDDQNRITQVANVHPTTGTLATFQYGYDLDAFTGTATQLGQRTSITSTIPSLSLSAGVTQLGYDARAELTAAVFPTGTPYSGLSQSWTYDAAKNRITSVENGTSSSYTYQTLGANPLNTSRLLSDGGNAYGYDAKGNNTSRSGSRGNYTFSYDYENRLRSVNGDLTAGYLYDYAGRRTLKTVSGVQTTYVYDGLHAVAESGAASISYLFGARLDEPLAMYVGGQIHYYAIDAQSTVAVVNDAGGNAENFYAYDAFGTARSATTAVANPLGYTARENAEAGLRYYRARYYEAAIGRFHSEDPIGFQGGSNVYAYVENDPVTNTDPSGLRPLDLKCCTQFSLLAQGEDHTGLWTSAWHKLGGGRANQLWFYVNCPSDKPRLTAVGLESIGGPPYAPAEHPWPTWDRFSRRTGASSYIVIVNVPTRTVLNEAWGVPRVRIAVECCK